MSYISEIILLILLLPLAGAILNGFFLRNVNKKINAIIAITAVFIPFLCSLFLFYALANSVEVNEFRVDLFDWITLLLNNNYKFSIPFSFTVDHLSAIMLLVVTGVGSLIHLYSAEYMSHEKGVYRFFAYLNLFIFSMLTLILGSNFLVVFLGWEGVGLCSYLLIGYWFEETANSVAGMKAFIVNRIGDLGFILAMFFALKLFSTLDFVTISQKIILFSPEWFSSPEVKTDLTLLGLSVLLGVTGKSAQIPLYIWLPDAMAGPTPVSALIHAATMVTAGVYLMTRVSFILVLSPTVMFTIACIGAATALFAATIGLVQNDIKKVLAYSTVSQLGFMVLACGVGAFSFGIAHLVTHAFFKALLFLGAGSVIYALHHEQDIRKMGGLTKKLPITTLTFCIGTLAIIGFPGFAGFFSKDEILYSAWTGHFGHPIFWGVGAVAAGLTSFYMVRLTILVFFGSTRVEKHYDHIHENNWVITLPLVVLAFFSVVGGLISIPHGISNIFGIHGESFIVRWLEPVLLPTSASLAALPKEEFPHSLEWLLMGSTVLIMLGMSYFAIKLYLKNGPKGGEVLSNLSKPLYNLVLDKWRIDELYAKIIVNPSKKVADLCFSIGDKLVIEGLVNGIPAVIRDSTQIASDLQPSTIRGYLKVIFLAIVVIIGAILWGI